MNELIIHKKYLFPSEFDGNKFRNNSFYSKIIFSSPVRKQNIKYKIKSNNIFFRF